MDWRNCAIVSIDLEVVHGEPVFAGTRMPVESAIESYYAYREVEGLSDEDAIKATLKSFGTIPDANAIYAVLAHEAAHEHWFNR